MKLVKTLKLMTAILSLVVISACSGSSGLLESSQEAGDSIMVLPTRLATLDAANLSAELKIYENGSIVQSVALTIANGQVSSGNITLSIGHTYHFVIEFYYTSDAGETLAIAYAVLDNQTMASGSTSFSFSASDIVYDQASTSPSISASTNGYDVPDLDQDDDGVVNIDEVTESISADTTTGTETSTSTSTATPPVITSFTASANMVTPGQSVTLSWEVSNFDSIELSTGVSGLAANGSQLVIPTAKTTYTLTAIHETTTATSSVTIDYDADSDGFGVDSDNCVSTANADQADFNGDGQGDVCDDTDGDSCLDSVDAFRDDAAECTDTDSDTVGDNADNCDLTNNVSQADFNNDGQGDACDDTDADTIMDDVDNCRQMANADQLDSNSDGYGNACSDRLFSGMGRLTTGSSPRDFGFGDFDGDGAADLISMDYNDNGYTIFYNFGGGTFASKISGSTGGTKPSFIAVDDFNNDSLADFAVSHSGSGSDNVIIHLNNGDGTFLTAPKTAVSNPSDIATDDLDGDGDIDIVVANAGDEDGIDENLSVYLNDGTGAFNKVTSTTWTVGDHPQGVVITDLNGDGIGDIGVSNEASSNTKVTVFLGSSTGADNYSYTSRTTPTVGINTRGISTGDIDGDGDDDVIVVSPYTDSVYVLINTAGVIANAVSIGTDSVGEYPMNVATGDFDADGIDDVVTADYTGGSDITDGTLSVLFGSGSASDYLTSLVSYDAPGLPKNVLVNDMDGDGNLDVMTMGELDETLKVFPGDDDGTFNQEFSAQDKLDLIGNPQELFAGSYEDGAGDGYIDLVVTDSSMDTLSVLRNNGSGGFSEYIEYSISSNPGSLAPMKAVMYDFNDDSSGHKDFATANFVNGSVSVIHNSGAGLEISTTYTTGSGTEDIVVADLDNNDDEDIVVVNRNSDSVSVLLGDSATTMSFASAVNYGVGDMPRRVIVADLDGNNVEDIIASNYGSDTISVLMGNGNGTFDSAMNYTVGDGPLSLVAADLNADGNVDLAVCNVLSDSISILTGNGDGTLNTKVDSGVGSGASHIAIADLHADGDADIVAVNYDSDASSLSILFGDGSGIYSENYRALVRDYASGLLVKDLDNDGFLDLAISSSENDLIDFYYNTSL